MFDFAMSALPTRFIFNGHRMLKDLAKQFIEVLLFRQPTEYVLPSLERVPLVISIKLNYKSLIKQLRKIG